PYGAGAISTRDNGGTAGVTNANGQSVFTSSVAPSAASGKSHHAGTAQAAQRARAAQAAHLARAARLARAAAPAAAPVIAPAPSARSATSDAWSGFAAPAKSPVSAATAYSAGQGGGGSQVFAGIAIL